MFKARDPGHPESKIGRLARTLWVGNLNGNDTEDTLKEIFTERSEQIAEYHMPLSDEGLCRGFAFVIFKDKENMNDTFEKMNKSEVNGRMVLCHPARQPSRKKVREKSRQSNSSFSKW